MLTAESIREGQSHSMPITRPLGALERMDTALR